MKADTKNMFDYRGWMEEARQFVSTLEERAQHTKRCELQSHFRAAPPLTEAEAKELETALGFHVPAALREFYTTATRHLNFHYGWWTLADEDLALAVFQDGTLYGGARFFDAAATPQEVEFYRNYEHIYGRFDEEEHNLRLHVLPFADAHYHVALDLRNQEENPPVVHLHPEGHAHVIAPSFTEFLVRWKELCYTNLDIDDLHKDLVGQNLDIDSERARVRRQILGEQRVA